MVYNTFHHIFVFILRIQVKNRFQVFRQFRSLWFGKWYNNFPPCNLIHNSERWQSLAECAALEMQFTLCVTGVRIPLSPHLVMMIKPCKSDFLFTIYFHQTTEMNQHMQFLLQKRDTIWDKDWIAGFFVWVMIGRF